MDIKGTTITEDMVLFYGSCFSQWARYPIIINRIEYNCCEQWMMSEKARAFEDYYILKRIMASDNPRDQKTLGKDVKDFNRARWDVIARSIVFKGNYAKFTQNEELTKILLSTGDRIIVEASPVDRVWGIGLGKDDPRALDKDQWKGTNWLGEVLMDVRSKIRKEG